MKQSKSDQEMAMECWIVLGKTLLIFVTAVLVGAGLKIGWSMVQ